jgi:deoxyhypusine synthase
VVCYVDSTVALPLITAYALARRKKRKPRRLYDRRGEMLNTLTSAYEKVRKKRLKRGES